jgi:hypothetical protein
MLKNNIQIYIINLIMGENNIFRTNENINRIFQNGDYNINDYYPLEFTIDEINNNNNSTNGNIIHVEPEINTEMNDIINKKYSQYKNVSKKKKLNRRINGNQSLGRKRGRRKLNESNNQNDILHKKSDEDNVIYKLKVSCFKCILSLLNELINKKMKIKIKLMAINGKYLKDGKKLTNIDFFNSTIRDILLLEKSKRIKHKIENIDIIEKVKKNYKIKNIINMKFIDFVEKVFMEMHSIKFEKIFGVKSKYLFKEMNFDNEQKETMKQLVSYGIIKYFKEKKERYRKNYKKLMIKIDTTDSDNYYIDDL